jgi:hypothetical protein
LTKFDLDGHNLGTVQSMKIQPIIVVIQLNFDQSASIAPMGSKSKQAHLMRFLCSLPYRMTESLIDHLPPKGRPWGAARKAINLFLRDALYTLVIVV